MMWLERARPNIQEATMAVFDKVENFIYEYAKFLNLDNMPDAVRAQFKKYEANGDFTKNMKEWPAIFEAINNGDTPKLDSEKKYQELFNLFQSVFEKMAQDSGKRSFQENKPLKEFFEEWYGRHKIFTEPEITPQAKARLEHFVKNVLENSRYKSPLEQFFKNHSLLPEGMDFDKFVKNLKDPAKQKSPAIRDALSRVVEYVNYFSRITDQENTDWPVELGAYDFSADMGPDAPAVENDTSKWFTQRYTPAFKSRVPELINTLVSKPKVFEYFKSKDSKGTISENIDAALGKTNYADEKSDDYVPEADKDVKNIFQRAGDKLKEIKENQIDPWTNILRGTRRFFSVQARQVIEACSKAKNKDGKKIKPTDGLKGILSASKDISAKLAKFPNARDHWKWISGKLEQYSAAVPEAFEGALRNPKKMRKIVSKFIIDAVKENKIDAAKTALEMISTMKYGIMHSRTVDALAKEDLTVVSDPKASWNKYEAGRFISGAMDKTARFALLSMGRGVAALHNKWMRDNTKFRGKEGFLKSAHSTWKDNNNKDEYDTTVRDAIDADLATARQDRMDAFNVLKTLGNSNSLPTAKQKIKADISQEKNSIAKNTEKMKKKQDLLKQKEQYLRDNPTVLADLQNGINNNNTQITNNNNNIATLGNDIANKDKDITNNANDITRNENDITDNNTKIETNKKTIEGNIKKIAQNNKLIAVKEAQIVKFQAQASGLQKKDPNRKKIQAKISKLKLEKSKLNIENTKLQANNIKLEEDNKKLQENGGRLQEQKAKLEELKRQLAEQKNQLESNKTELENKNSDLQNDNSEKTHQMDELSPASLDALRDDINVLQTDLDASNDFVKERQDALDKFDNSDFAVKNLIDQSRAAHKKSDTWNDKHNDKYVELMAYWDMLESFGKSHQFTFAANRMRDKFLAKDQTTGKSKADVMSAEFLKKYKEKYNL